MASTATSSCGRLGFKQWRGRTYAGSRAVVADIGKDGRSGVALTSEASDRRPSGLGGTMAAWPGVELDEERRFSPTKEAAAHG
jgi:hypothetical protein